MTSFFIRYELFRSGLLNKLDTNAKETSQSLQYPKENGNSPPASSSSSDHGSPPFTGNTAYSNLDNASSDKANGSSKDEGYWEKRRKNNEAARRSRNVRKAKEQETGFFRKESSGLTLQEERIYNRLKQDMITRGTHPNLPADNPRERLRREPEGKYQETKDRET